MGNAIDTVVDDIHLKKKAFPFQCYLNWPIRDLKAYPDGRHGNVLADDQIFLKLLYYANGEKLDEGKGQLRDFMDEAGKVVLAVDCENSDPYKLCAAMWELKSEDPQSFSKIKKTVLFDDVHTSETWNDLSEYLPMPVEHILTQRVNDHKSLVDIQLTAGVAKEHYAEGVDSFLLASSDSDYWGLIKSLPTAKFLVMIQEEKTGTGMRRTLEENGVGCYSLDEVDTDKIHRMEAAAQVRKALAEVAIDLNGFEVEAYVEDGILRLRLVE